MVILACLQNIIIYAMSDIQILKDFWLLIEDKDTI